MKMFATVSLGILMVSSFARAAPPTAPSSSQARASEDATEQAVNTVTDEKVICRRDKTVGSRLRAERICLTKAEWAVRLREQRTKIEQGQAQRTYTNTQ